MCNIHHKGLRGLLLPFWSYSRHTQYKLKGDYHPEIPQTMICRSPPSKILELFAKDAPRLASQYPYSNAQSLVVCIAQCGPKGVVPQCLLCLTDAATAVVVAVELWSTLVEGSGIRVAASCEHFDRSFHVSFWRVEIVSIDLGFFMMTK